MGDEYQSLALKKGGLNPDNIYRKLCDDRRAGHHRGKYMVMHIDKKREAMRCA